MKSGNVIIHDDVVVHPMSGIERFKNQINLFCAISITLL